MQQSEAVGRPGLGAPADDGEREGFVSGEHPKLESGARGDSGLVQGYVDDIQVMLKHVPRVGARIDDGLASEIDALCDAKGGGAAKRGDLDRALKVHGKLCELLAPATPESIRASTFEGNRGLFWFLFLSGIVSFAAYVVPTTAKLFVESKSGWTGAVATLFQLLGAAGLGATFFALSEARGYLRTYTFERRYNQDYVVRFVLGLFAGYILGTQGLDLLDFANGGGAAGQADGTVTEVDAHPLAATMLALVGGYSAEAVNAVLKRVADTLLTMVRGSDKDREKARVEQAAVRRSKVALELQGALGENDAETLRKRVQAVLPQLNLPPK